MMLNQTEDLKSELLHILSQLTDAERKELWDELVRDGLISDSLTSLSPEL